MRNALIVLAACSHPPAPPISHVPDAGIAIAMYAHGTDAYSVVDDRRSIDITGDRLELDHVDPGAALASLVIEGVPVDGCTRDELPDGLATAPPGTTGETDDESTDDDPDVPAPKPPPPPPATPRFTPVVRCHTTAPRGPHRVRIVYVTKTLTYRGQHDVTMTAADRATVTSRFAIATPRWDARADVTLYDGVPGGDQPPREIVRGQVTLDGSISVIAMPPAERAARLQRVYHGAVVSPDPDAGAGDPAWGRESQPEVWVWLELQHVELAPGPVHVHVELPDEPLHERDVAMTDRVQAPGAPLRLPLWIDPDLHGTRQRTFDLSAGAAVADRLLFSIGNTGQVARDVWIEEPLRPVHVEHRRVDRAWPARPAYSGDMLRLRLRVPPGRIERAGYTVAYD